MFHIIKPYETDFIWNPITVGESRSVDDLYDKKVGT